MAGSGDLYALCRETLNAANAALATDAPGGAIARAYVSPGPPVYDCCPQITVHAGGTSEATTAPLSPPLSSGHRAEAQGSLYLISLVITVLRCVPVVTQTGQTAKLPSANSIEAAAVETLGDIWAIWHGMRRAYQAGALFVSPSGKREFFFEAAFPINTQGGCAGWQIPFRVQLSGYP